jgi:hypothetical protein
MTADRAWRPTGPRFLPLAAIPFILAAFVPVVLSWSEWTIAFASDPNAALTILLAGVLPGVSVPLIGAAIVIRHPRAHRSVPSLLFGASLVTVQVVGVRHAPQLLDVVFPRSINDILSFELVYTATYVVLAAIGAFGWAYLASGLVRARRYEDVRGTGVIVFIVIALAIIASSMQIGAQDFSLGRAGGVPGMALVAAVLVVGLLEKLAIGYMAVTATRGWRAGEAPRRGWALAAIGAWLLLVALLVVAAVPLLGEDWMQVYDPTWVLRGISLLFGAGGVALLVAFALGLPDVDGITWYDLAELDAAVAGASGQARDPFDDSTAGDDVELFELEDRRLDR